MATANVPNNPLSPLPSAASTARALFVGLLWGALMLAVFGLWMRSKYDAKAPVVTPIFLISSLVAAALALWQGFTLWFAKETPDQKIATLTNQQRLFSYAFLAGGLGLIVLAFVVGVVKKESGSYGFALDNFGETVGCLLFGLIALSAGYVLQLPREPSQSPMQFLVAKVPVLKLSMVIVGAICLVSFVYLGFVKQIGADWLPELAALIFMSMLCVTCFFMLNTASIDEFGVRLFVLTFGGLTGLILFFLSLGRAYAWRQDIFLGGIVAWQGPDAWHFWLCAYVFFASLVLMFVSFNLARTDIRTSVVLRRVMYGYDTIVQGLLVVGILAVMNVVVYAMVPFTYDWTKTRGAYAISDSTKNLVGNLKKDVNIVVVLPQTTWVYKDVRILLDNMQALSPRFHVQYVSPDIEQMEYQRLLSIFPQIIPDMRTGQGGRGILIVNGAIPAKETDKVPPYAFVPERKLFEVDRQGMQTGGRNQNFFKGEAEIVRELKFLLQDKTKRKVYILQGNDEPNFADEGLSDRIGDFRVGFRSVGIGMFADKLKQDNYDVFGLAFLPESLEVKTPNMVIAKAEGPGKKKEVPADCKTLIVAGVSRPLPAETVEAIERYMEKGEGKMVVFLDVIANEDFSKLKDTGLEPLLKRFGVEVTDQYALSIIDPRGADPRILWAETPLKSDNPLAKSFADKFFFLKRSARILKPAETPGRYRAESIMELYPYSERNEHPTVNIKDVRALSNPQGYMFHLLTQNQQELAKLVNRAPAVVGVAVTDSQGDKPCLVVFGDTDFIINRELAGSKSRTENYAMAVGAMEWVAEREAIGAPPKVNSNFALPPGVNFGRMILLPGWLMLLVMVGLGIGIWITRRR